MKNKKNLLLAILGITITTRLIFLFLNKSFWLDEAMIYSFSTKNSLWELISGNYYDFAEHPFIHYLFIKLFSMVSIQETWLRLVPVTFSIGNTYLLYRVGKKIHSEKVGIIAAFLFSFSVFHILHGTEIKYYQTTLFFQLLSLLITLSALEFRQRKWWVYAGLSYTFCFLSDYSSIWYLSSLAFFFVILLFVKRKKKKEFYNFITNLTFAGGTFFISSLYWLVKLHSVSTQSLARQSYLPTPTFDDLFRVIGSYISFYWLNGIEFPQMYLWYTVIAIVPFGIALYGFTKKPSLFNTFFLIWLVAPLFISFGISQYNSIFIYYNLQSISFPLYFLFAIAISTSKKLLYLSIGLYIGLNIISVTSPRLYKDYENWRTFYKDMKMKEDTEIYFSPEYLMYSFAYYRDVDSKNSFKEIQNTSYGKGYQQEKNTNELCIATLQNQSIPMQKDSLKIAQKTYKQSLSGVYDGASLPVYYECFLKK